MTERAHRKAQTSHSMSESMSKRSVPTVGGNRRANPSVSYPQQKSFTPVSLAKGSQGPKTNSGSSKPLNRTNMRHK